MREMVSKYLLNENYSHIVGMPSYAPTIANYMTPLSPGAGADRGEMVKYKSLGEARERKHFITSVKVDKTGRLTDLNSEKLQQQLISLTEEIKITDSHLTDITMQLSRVSNLFTQQSEFFPTGLISLGLKSEAEYQLMPFTDSCGCASHITAEQSYESAMSEFLERQALVGAWLSGRYKYRVEADVLTQLGINEILAKTLLDNGDVYVFDLANELPCYVTLVLFFSKSKLDNVQYSVGLAADLDPKSALKKALNETWHVYNFLYCSIGQELDLATIKYAHDFQTQFNDTTNAREAIPWDIDSTEKLVSADEYLAMPHYTDDDVRQSLYAISDQIYQYVAVEPGEPYVYTRIISPDFYLHMSIDEPLNFRNNYAKLIKAKEIPNNGIKAIPFP